MALNDIGEEVTRRQAEVEELVLEEFLDKNGLKGKTVEELQTMGYILKRSEAGIPFDTKRTWTLYKVVDSVSYRYKVRIEPDITSDNL